MAKQKQPKPRLHREWFRTVMGKRKSCPSCKEKLAPGESIWSWGEYTNGKWRTIEHFCKNDWEDKENGFDPSHKHLGIKSRLLAHAKDCGCEFELVGYRGEKLPEWLTLREEVCDAKYKP